MCCLCSLKSSIGGCMEWIINHQLPKVSKNRHTKTRKVKKTNIRMTLTYLKDLWFLTPNRLHGRMGLEQWKIHWRHWKIPIIQKGYSSQRTRVWKIQRRHCRGMIRKIRLENPMTSIRGYEKNRHDLGKKLKESLFVTSSLQNPRTSFWEHGKSVRKTQWRQYVDMEKPDTTLEKINKSLYIDNKGLETENSKSRRRHGKT